MTVGLSVSLMVSGMVLLVAAWSVATRRKLQASTSADPLTSPAGGLDAMGHLPTAPTPVVGHPAARGRR